MSMRRILYVALLALVSVAVMAQKAEKEKVVTKVKGLQVVNTTTLCDKVGFKSTTPLKVTIKKDKVVSVEPLPNGETPRFFKRVVDEMLPNFVGKKLNELDDVDGVSGATMSSNAVRENVRASLKYVKKQ